MDTRHLGSVWGSFSALFKGGMRRRQRVGQAATRGMVRRRPVTRLADQAEVLECRALLAFDPTAQEQEYLELINTMRMDPQGHLATLFTTTNPLVSPDPEAQASINFFNVTSASFLPEWQKLTPAQPLTWNEAVYNATRTHNLLVLQNDAQEHQFPGEPNSFDRIANAGFANLAVSGENLFSFSKSVFQGHSGLAIDWGVPDLGHRLNIMDKRFTETGVSIIAQTDGTKKVGPLAIAQNFASTFAPTLTYITGVAYNDTDANGRYTAGEGLGGVTVTVTGGTGGPRTVNTMTAGGYRVEVPDGTYTVTYSGGGLASPKTFHNVVVAGKNVKIDTTGQPGIPSADSSGKPYFIAAVGGGLTDELKQGQTVATLLVTGNAGTTGLALSAVDKTLGNWQYTLVASPAEADWINVDAAGALSTTNALLLPDTARLRFVTTLKPHHTGTTAQGFLPLETKLDSGLTYRVWDKTGTAGGRVDSTVGGAFGTTDIVAQTYFEVRLFRSFNQNAELNVYTLQAEFEVLTGPVGYQDRSTLAYSGFTVFLSQLPSRVATTPLFRMYYGTQFNDDGTETDMGYRYLTSSGAEAGSLEGLGRAAKRPLRDGAYFREQGVNSGNSAIGYIYAALQPGTAEMSQVYRTDQFDKPRRQGTTPAGTVKQEQGDHVYTTVAAFEMGKKGTWRQEATRGFVRELSTAQTRVVQPAVAAAIAEIYVDVVTTSSAPAIVSDFTGSIIAGSVGSSGLIAADAFTNALNDVDGPLVAGGSSPVVPGQADGDDESAETSELDFVLADWLTLQDDLAV